MQINSINSLTNFSGVNFTPKAKRAVERGIEEYAKGGGNSDKMRNMYKIMQEDKSMNCKFDINKDNYVTLTFPITEKLENTCKNEKRQNYVSYNQLNDLYLYIAKRITDFRRV